MRYRLRTLLLITAIAPAIVWALTIGLATYLERVGLPAYKPSPERGPAATRAVKVLKQSVP